MLEIVQFAVSVMPDQIYIPILLLLWWLWSGKQWPKFVVAVSDTGGAQAALNITEASTLCNADFSILCFSSTPFSVEPVIAPKLRIAAIDIGINASGRLKRVPVLNFSSHADFIVMIPLPTSWDAVAKLMLRPRCAFIQSIPPVRAKGPRVISRGVQP